MSGGRRHTRQDQPEAALCGVEPAGERAHAQREVNRALRREPLGRAVRDVAGDEVLPGPVLRSEKPRRQPPLEVVGAGWLGVGNRFSPVTSRAPSTDDAPLTRPAAYGEPQIIASARTR